MVVDLAEILWRLLNTMGIKSTLSYVLDLDHLRRAIAECIDGKYQILHLSCHGDEKGIALADNHQPTWVEFAGAFQDMSASPIALVMSSCCGASSGIGRAFEDQARHPRIIFGSTDKLGFSQYAAAWAVLYYRFRTDGFKISAAKTALEQIADVVHSSFVYRRRDESTKRCLRYP